MFYKFRHFFISALATTMTWVGVLMVVFSLIGTNLMGFVFGIFLLTVFGSTWYRLRRYRKKTFLWYKERHLGLVSPDGAVQCHKCQSKLMGVRNLRDWTKTREHFCRTCGETLYFSRTER